MKLLKIRRSSVYYRFTAWVWQQFSEEPNIEKTKNACAFLWGRTIGGSLFLLFLIILSCIIIPIGWFFGFHPIFNEEERKRYREGTLFYPYKFNGKKYQRFAPWQITLIFGPILSALGASIYFSLFNQSGGIEVGKITGIVVGLIIAAILLLVLLVFLFSKTWRSRVGANIRATAKGACPPVEFVD